MNCQMSLQSSIELSSLSATLAVVTSTMMIQTLESHHMHSLLAHAPLSLPQAQYTRRSSNQLPPIANLALCISPLEVVPSRADANSCTLTQRSGPEHGTCYGDSSTLRTSTLWATSHLALTLVWLVLPLQMRNEKKRRRAGHWWITVTGLSLPLAAPCRSRAARSGSGSRSV